MNKLKKEWFNELDNQLFETISFWISEYPQKNIDYVNWTKEYVEKLLKELQMKGR